MAVWPFGPSQVRKAAAAPPEFESNPNHQAEHDRFAMEMLIAQTERKIRTSISISIIPHSSVLHVAPIMMHAIYLYPYLHLHKVASAGKGHLDVQRLPFVIHNSLD